MSMKVMCRLWVLCALLCGLTPLYGFDDVNVRALNAYLYSGGVSYMPKDVIPLYGLGSRLQVDVYNGDTYFGEMMKATEYPVEVYTVTYSNGHIQTVQEEGNNHFIRFQWNGSVLEGYQIFDLQTGATLETRTLSIRYMDIVHKDGKTIVLESYGFNWGKTPFLGIEYKDSFYLNFYTFSDMRDGNMEVTLGTAYRKSSWFLDNGLGAGWKRRPMKDLAEAVATRSGGVSANARNRLTYNRLGLLDQKGMSAVQCQSQGGKNGRLYYYFWNE